MTPALSPRRPAPLFAAALPAALGFSSTRIRSRDRGALRLMRSTSRFKFPSTISNSIDESEGGTDERPSGHC
jgi:hypothetical protein